MIQVLPNDQYAPIYALQRVEPSSNFKKCIEELIVGSEVRMNHTADLFPVSA